MNRKTLACSLLIAIVIGSAGQSPTQALALGQASTALPPVLEFVDSGPVWMSAGVVAETPIPTTAPTHDSSPGDFARTESVESLRYRLTAGVRTAKPCSHADDSDCLASPSTEAARGGCYQPQDFWGYDLRTRAESADSFDELVDRMEFIGSGIVVGSEVGFGSNMSTLAVPGKLLKVEIQRWLRSPENVDAAPGTAFAFYGGEADFWIGDVHVCHRRAGWPDAPEVGARVLLFSEFKPVNTSGGDMFLPTYVAGLDIAWETPVGVRVPPGLEQKSAEFRLLDFDALERFMRRSARGLDGDAQ